MRKKQTKKQFLKELNTFITKDSFLKDDHCMGLSGMQGDLKILRNNKKHLLYLYL